MGKATEANEGSGSWKPAVCEVLPTIPACHWIICFHTLAMFSCFRNLFLTYSC